MHNMKRPLEANLSLHPDPSIDASWIRIKAVSPYSQNAISMSNQSWLFCPANREREILKQNLEAFWAQQKNQIEDFTEFHNRKHLPLARIRRVMKSNPEVKMVTAEAPVILGIACEMFIKELTLRSWLQAQSCSRRTIQPHDISQAVKNSEAYEFLSDLVSIEPHSVSHHFVPKSAFHEELFPPANVNGPNMEARTDMYQREQDNLMADRLINSEEFDLNPNLQFETVPKDKFSYKKRRNMKNGYP